MTADATGLPVQAGPTEATVIGNALVQLISLGEISNLEEGRNIITGFDEIEQFDPRDKEPWDEAAKRLEKL
jgi:rhamnulokinase